MLRRGGSVGRIADTTATCSLLPFAIGPAQFLADDATKHDLERFLTILNEGPEGIVDLGLVVPASCQVGLLSKPVEHVVVEANGDAGLARRRRHNGAASGVGEVVVLTHGHGF